MQQLCVHSLCFWLEPTQLSVELYVSLMSCLHYRGFQRASSKHSPGKVSTERTHRVAARHWKNYLYSGVLIRVLTKSLGHYFRILTERLGHVSLTALCNLAFLCSFLF